MDRRCNIHEGEGGPRQNEQLTPERSGIHTSSSTQAQRPMALSGPCNWVILILGSVLVPWVILAFGVLLSKICEKIKNRARISGVIEQFWVAHWPGAKPRFRLNQRERFD